MSLQGRNVAITGGTGGIGSEVVRYMASRGANVAFTYHSNKEKAEQLEKEAEGLGGTVTAYQCDIKDMESVKEFAKEVYAKLKKVDVLVNNAGIRNDRAMLFMKEKEWLDVIGTNLSGTYYASQAFTPYMMREKSGRMVNISSISGIYGTPGQVNYSASKAGMIGFTKALAKELIALGITVNAIAPGPVDTEMLKGMPEKKKEELIQSVPAKRACTAKEVAMVAAFLADSELSPAYLTGQVITLDGGMGL